jgi:sugar lactone lactonase YvrE
MRKTNRFFSRTAALLLALAPAFALAQVWHVTPIVTNGLNYPYGVAVDDALGDVFVADTFNNAIHKYSPNGSGGYITQTDVVNTALNHPYGVAVEQGGNDVIVADTVNNAVHDYQPTGFGNYNLKDVANTGLNNPYGVAIGGGGVFVADTVNNAIHSYRMNSSFAWVKQPDVVNDSGGTPNALNRPEGVAADLNGDVFIADTNNSAIHEYTLIRSSLYAPLADVASVLTPFGVAVDGAGNVYVSDPSNNAIHEYALNGSGVYIQQADVADGLNNPNGVAADRKGNVYIADTSNQRILRASLGTTCGGVLSQSLAFSDNFAGTSLNSSNWTTNVNGGSVSVANYGVSLSAPNGPNFPYITSVGSPIPATGAFSVHWVATYTAVQGTGTASLALSQGVPANGASHGYPAADAWEDSTNGYRVETLTSATNQIYAYQQNPPQAMLHDVEYCWLPSVTEVWVDGVKTSSQARGTDVPRPDSLWFGNPENAGGSAAWTPFTLNGVEVRSLVTDEIFANGFGSAPTYQ